MFEKTETLQDNCHHPYLQHSKQEIEVPKDKIRSVGQYAPERTLTDLEGYKPSFCSALGTGPDLWNPSVLCLSQAWTPPARSKWKTLRTPLLWSPGPSPWPRSTALSSHTGSKMCQATEPASTSHTRRTSTPSGTWSQTQSTRFPSSPTGPTCLAAPRERPSQQVTGLPLLTAPGEERLPDSHPHYMSGCLPGSFYSGNNGKGIFIPLSFILKYCSNWLINITANNLLRQKKIFAYIEDSGLRFSDILVKTKFK